MAVLVEFPLDPELLALVDLYAKRTGQAPRDAIGQLIKFGLAAVAARIVAGRFE
jgi:hypothetical protein